MNIFEDPQIFLDRLKDAYNKSQDILEKAVEESCKIYVDNIEKLAGELKRVELKQYEPSVPPGWRLTSTDADGRCKGGYFFGHSNSKKWLPCNLMRFTCDATLIEQTIDIDLSKQPEELVAFAMTEDIWFGYTSVPYLNGIWTGPTNWRSLFKSEYPDTWRGDWRDSLIVRPEALHE